MRTLTSLRRTGSFGLVAGLLLALTVGTTGAIAHPGVHLQDGKYGQNPTAGPGVVVNSPAGLAGFLSGVQWGDTGSIEDQSAQLVYGGTGCTPASYAEVAGEIAGNIALIESGASQTNPLDQCPAATFLQRVQSAQQAGAIGVVAIPAEGAEPNGNATAVAADIPAIEVHRTEAVLAVRDAVIAGTAVEVTLVDPTVELEALRDVPCVDGQAGPFACDGIDLLAFVPQEEFNGAGVSDLWGWTDEASGDEYVIIGKTNGVAFFRVSEPTAPEYLGELPNPAVLEEIWHDIKVYADHAFIVSESEPHGMTVFDLTRLRDVVEPQTWDRDAFYPLTSAAHNVEINTDTGFAYIVGGNAGLVVPDVCLSGLHMVDISTPTSPTFAGCYVEEGGPGTLARTAGEPATDLSPAAYVHDTQCVVYDGPDERYTGRELCFNSAEDKVVIADVTDKTNPVTVGWTDYPHVAYAHQGWLTEDHAYLLVNDELDELTYPEEVPTTRTVVLDVTDLENPTFHFGTSTRPARSPTTTTSSTGSSTSRTTPAGCGCSTPPTSRPGRWRRSPSSTPSRPTASRPSTAPGPTTRSSRRARSRSAASGRGCSCSASPARTTRTRRTRRTRGPAPSRSSATTARSRCEPASRPWPPCSSTTAVRWRTPTGSRSPACPTAGPRPPIAPR
jgi:choice-of-anchor B domain-containing protein